MNKNHHSAAWLRKRKMLLVLPLLVLPFITMAFWALGGGKTDVLTKKNLNKDGLNLQLPDAKLQEDKGLNKLSYYEIAAADSAKLKERMRNDPYFKIATITPVDDTNHFEQDKISGLNRSPYNQYGTKDSNEEKIMRKLKQLNASLDNTLVENTQKTSNNSQLNHSFVKETNSTVEPGLSLDGAYQGNPLGANTEDADIHQIDGMLDKIMDIQHPDRVRERLQQNSLQHQQQVFPVAPFDNTITISLLDPKINGVLDTNGKVAFKTLKNEFYSIDEPHAQDAAITHAINAVVQETQIIVPGSTVKMRLLGDIYLNGTLIPKDNFIYGRANLNGERLTIEIKSIYANNILYPVALSVYDLDGIDGIYIPGAIERNAAKESSDKAIQSVALNSLNPTIGTQAAGAGIEAAKTLLSKKVKLIKVTLKAGYQVLLKDNNNK